MSLQALINASRRYGSDPHLVLLGGGNTSYKEGNILYVKASGHPLGSIDEGGFVRMDRSSWKQFGIKSSQTMMPSGKRKCCR